MDKPKPNPRKPQFFKATLSTSDQQLSIPVSFMSYLKGEQSSSGEAVLRSSKLERSWPVKVEGRRFQHGWQEFARDHQLSVGDCLVFRHRGRMVFDVMVFDSSMREYPPSDVLNHGGGARKKRQKDSGEKTETIATSASNPTPLLHGVEQGQFTVQLQAYNLRKPGRHMNIPSQFARINGLMERFCVITLKDENGRSWQVNLKHKKTYDLAYIGGGWREFMDDNRLEMGDVCTFKLVSGGENVVMEVSISRSCGSQHLLTDSSSECERVEPPLVDKESIRKSCRKG